jgi:hypothetical protein
MSDKPQKPILEAPIKPTESKEKLNEFSLSWAGKLFFAGAAAYILGKGAQRMRLPIKVRGNPGQMRAIVDAIISSRRFQQELSRPGATIDGVINKLNLRNITKQQFRSLTGRNWPL